MDRRESKTKKEIQANTLLLLKNKNIYELTVKEICDKSNIGRSTFYLHYDDINDLIGSIEDETLLGVINVCIENINKKIDELCIIVANFIKNDYTVYKTLILRTNNHFENKLKNKFEHLFLSYFLKTDNTFFAKYYFSFVINGAIGVVKDWILDDCKIDAEILVKEFIINLKAGIN